MSPLFRGKPSFAAQQSKVANKNSHQWNEETFFERLNESEAQVAQGVLAWSQQSASSVFWGKGSTGSFIPLFLSKNKKHYLLTVLTSGIIEINFQWMLNRHPFQEMEKKRELQEKLNSISGVIIPDDALARRPTIKLSVLTQGDNMSKFLSICDWYVQQIKAEQ